MITMEEVKFLKKFYLRLISVHKLNNSDELRQFEKIISKLYREALLHEE